MKKYLTILIATIFISSLPILAGAVPMVYTFDCTVTATADISGIINPSDTPNGLEFSTEFIVDFDRDAYKAGLDGVDVPTEDTADTDFFYTQLITELPTTAPGWNSDPDLSIFNVGTDDLSATDEDRLRSGTWSEFIDIYQDLYGNESVREWNIGTPGLKGQICIATESLDWAGVNFNVELVSIEGYAPAPVPEPATMLLFGTGIMGLAGFRKKFKQ